MGKNRDLNKFKIDKNGKVFIDYTAYNPKTKTTDRFTIESDEEPRGELVEALQDLVNAAVEFGELPETWIPTLTVRSITETHKDDVNGAVITVLRELDNSNSPLVINTPHKTDGSYTEVDDTDIGLMSIESRRMIGDLEREIWRYVEGERAQLTLDFPQTESGGR